MSPTARSGDDRPGLSSARRATACGRSRRRSSRQILQVSTVTRQGDRDFIKLRPFAKINATSAPKPNRAARSPLRRARASSPTTAPTRAAGGTAGSRRDPIYGAEVDGEVSIKIADFPIDAASIDDGQRRFETAEVEQIVRAAAHFLPATAAQVAALPYVDPSRFGDDPGATIRSPRSA